MSAYSVHRDQFEWDDPEIFRPERFLDKDGKLISNKDLFFFGFGKKLNCFGDFI